MYRAKLDLTGPSGGEEVAIVTVAGTDAPARAQGGLVTVTSIAPAGALELHRHLNAEKATILLRGEGEHVSDAGVAHQGLHEVAFVRPGVWSGFRNVGNEPAVLLTIYGTVTSESQLQTETAAGDVEPTSGPVEIMSAPDPIPTASTMHPEPLIRVGNHRMFHAATGAKTLFGGLARFEAGGYHTRHRHPGAEELILFFNDGASIAGETDDLPMSDHELVVIPIDAWHGVKGAEDRETHVFYAYLGVADRDAAGVELWDDVHAAT